MEKKKRTFLQVEIDEDLRNEAKEAAQARGTTLSEVIRKYLRRYVKANND